MLHQILFGVGIRRLCYSPRVMETLNIGALSLSGVAQGGRQTSIHCPGLKCVFDAGADLGVDPEHVFLTHGHADHAGALPLLVARHALLESGRTLHVHAPKALVSDLRKALSHMEAVFGGRRSMSTEVHGVEPGDEVRLSRNHTVRVVRTFHGAPSCGFVVFQTSKKLREEFHGLPGRELGVLRRSGVVLEDPVEVPVLAVPGDTLVRFFETCEEARKARTLLHEVTFHDDGELRDLCHERGHTHLLDMAEVCEGFEGENLVFVHRSLRHSREEAERQVRKHVPSSMRDKVRLFDGGDR